MNNKYILLFFSLIFCSFQAQTWTFNTNTLQNWSAFRFTPSYTSNSIILTTTGQTNPRLDNVTAGVNATNNTFAEVTLKVGANGPTMLRINYGSNFKSRVITNNNSEFVTYTINMTDGTWSGTQNDIQLAFKTDDGSAGGGNFATANTTVEIQRVRFIPNPYASAAALYVDPNNGNNANTGVSAAAPLSTIPYALDTAAANNISKVYIKSGTYNFTSTINVTTVAGQMITLSPEPGGNVKILSQGNRAFRFYSNAKNIEVKGIEVNGQSNATDHWTMLSKYVWQPGNITPAEQGGGIAFSVEEAQDIKITENIIHDFYQKAVNITEGRYVTVKGNIVYNIALTSLSGGHAIMRQQGYGSFLDADDPAKYRWDIDGNLIYNVHQRIYSWVPAKGYLNMGLDEGKPILIDETPNHDQNMKARIQNNIIAYFKIDGMRLKPTNNLEVRNNSLFSTDAEHGDGITDTTSGYNSGNFGSPFVNFQCFNNVVQVNSVRQPYELAESLGSTNATFGNNYSSYGNVAPSNAATVVNAATFVNGSVGNFNLSSAVPSGNGAAPSVISALMTKAAANNITVADNNWVNDHLKNAQTLFDNVPGIEDGINGNEPVFTDAGIYDLSDLEYNSGRKSLYFSVNPTWKMTNGVTDGVLTHNDPPGLSIYNGKYEIVTPEKYSEWYDLMKATYLRDSNNDGTDDSPYARIRYGASVIAQNKILNNNSLHVVEIKSATDYTQTTAASYNVVLDGDILINFINPPSGSETYDLITAGSITSANTGNIWDRVRIVGYTGSYTLTIVSGNTLRLSLGGFLSVNDTKKGEAFSVYPNPADAKNGFSIELSENDQNPVIKLYSSDGREITLKISVEGKRVHALPQAGISAGVYIVSCESKGKIRSSKIIFR